MTREDDFDRGLNRRVATHSTFSVPQLNIALQGAPGGSPIVLSHALGLDLHMWDELAAELGSEHRVLRYDHRGQGGSAAPPGPYTMRDLVDDAARVVREWGVGPVVWVGLSMGGMVGQGLAIQHPELVRGLVLANTTAAYPPEAATTWSQRISAVTNGGMPAVVDAVLERYLTPAFRAAHPKQVARYRRTLLRSDRAGYAASCSAVAGVDWLEQLGVIRAPTLVIAGALDKGATPAMAQAIAERIKGSELAVLDASHLSVAEQPAAFSALVHPFLAKVDNRKG